MVPVCVTDRPRERPALESRPDTAGGGGGGGIEDVGDGLPCFVGFDVGIGIVDVMSLLLVMSDSLGMEVAKRRRGIADV